jgi:hypothetical protein
MSKAVPLGKYIVEPFCIEGPLYSHNSKCVVLVADALPTIGERDISIKVRAIITGLLIVFSIPSGH